MTKSYARPTIQRKQDHIRICLEEDVSFKRLTSGLEKYHFVHQALPELNLDAIDLGTSFMGVKLRAPLLISSMTGGTPHAQQINDRLAQAAQANGIALGVGSVRAAIEKPSLADTFRVRRSAPDILLLANLGAVQLNYGYDLGHCQRAVDLIQADGLVLHLNPLQEALQPEGDTNWTGLLNKIETICRAMPVIVKEVGWGISAQVASQLANAGVAAIDIAGAGGTSWSQVELHRTQDASSRQVAEAFRDWGLATDVSIKMARKAVPHLPLIASGGIRDGVDIAKCIALGASLVGIAKPFLHAASQSTEAVYQLIQSLLRALQIAMFCVGASNVSNLSATPLIRLTDF